eukprot:7157882-Pyramimonas_sp.AAC.1
MSGRIGARAQLTRTSWAPMPGPTKRRRREGRRARLGAPRRLMVAQPGCARDLHGWGLSEAPNSLH